MNQILDALGEFSGTVLWGPWTFFILMGAGILFTIWSRFCQYTAMTHGVQVVRGVYDDPNDPGAINHFQALSAALSATVGLGNIGGVALAIAAGGPGALFWMWLIGLFGMALKTIEITLAMIYRNTDDPENPHGGAMWVIDKVLGGKGGAWKGIARAIGIFFCITLLISSFTGGNMFQSWNVATLTKTYFDIPRLVTGIVLAMIVGLVIVGGIKRIGQVAGRLVPFMCVLYLICALAVLAMHVPEIPRLIALVVKSAFNPVEAGGAFLGGSLYWAFSQGLRRALFSNEAGQGSAPIAHAAAKTNEPAREGVVGGMGPFIDTICICTLTALVILSTGTWNRDPLLPFEITPESVAAYRFADSPLTVADDAADAIADGDRVYLTLATNGELDQRLRPAPRLRGVLRLDDDGVHISWQTYNSDVPDIVPTSLQVTRVAVRGEMGRVIGTLASTPEAVRAVDDDGVPLWGLLSADQAVEIDDDSRYLWEHIKRVFVVVEADPNADTGFDRHHLAGEAMLSDDDVLTVEWGTLASEARPTLVEPLGLYRDYDGAALTAHAFDREFPGLGKWLVTVAAWLFAISTMISWSYYGEQGVIYMFRGRLVLPYKILYLALAIFAAAWITDTAHIEALMDLGTGAMLWSNIPIVVGCGFLAVRSLRDYRGRLNRGEMPRRGARNIEDLVSDRFDDQ
jgi:AGCS family alanine or glycine:cation symporter